jgi:hypothetical protein
VRLGADELDGFNAGRCQLEVVDAKLAALGIGVAIDRGVGVA